MAEKRKSIEERYEELKKKAIEGKRSETNESTRKSIEERYEELKLPYALEAFNTRVQKYAEDSSAYFNEYTGRYYDKDGNYINQYRGDSSDWLNTVQSKRDYFSTEAEAIKTAVEKYKPYISEDSYNEIFNMLSSNSKAFEDIYNSAVSENDYFSQFKSEDAFKEALAEAEEYEAKRTYDLKAGEAEINGLRKDLATTRAMAENYVPSMPSEEYLKQETTPEARQKAIDEWNNRQRQNWFNAAADIEEQIREKESYYNEAERTQNAYKLAAVANPNSEYYDPEFEKYAQMGEAIENPSYEDVQRGKGEIQNPAKYVRDNYNRLVASNGRVLSGGTKLEIQGLGLVEWNEMTDDEYKTYNYYLALDSINARKGNPTNNAEKYLESLDLTRRWESGQFEWYAQLATERPVEASAVSVVTSFVSGLEYLENIFNYASTGEMDRAFTADVTNTIRGTVSKNVDWDVGKLVSKKTGLEIGSWDAFDFLYNTGMSGVDSAAASLAFGKAGSVALGLSAASQATNDALDRGMSNSQAFWNGLMSGVFEGVFEWASIGQFDALKDAFVKGGKDIAKNLAKTMLVNASEETLTEIANLTYDRLINADFSQYEIAVNKYMEQGMTKAEAISRVTQEQTAQVVEAGASGALMGLGFGTVGSAANAVSSYKAGNAIKQEGNVDTLVELGKKFSPDSDVAKFAGSINEKSSPLAIGRLLMGVQGSLSEQNMTDIQNALVEKGVSKSEAAKLSQWMNQVVEGGELTAKQIKTLESNEALAEVLYGTILQPDSSVMQRNQLYDKLYNVAKDKASPKKATEAKVEENADAVSQKSETAPKVLSAEELDAKLSEFIASNKALSPQPSKKKTTAVVEPSSAKVADVSEKTSDTGKTTVISTGQEVDIQKIESIDPQSGTMKLKMKDGSVVDSKDISYGNETQGVLYESVLESGYDAHTANAIVYGYKADSGVSVSDYLLGVNEAYNYGWGHIPEAARTGVGYKALTPSQQEYAYKLGEDARGIKSKTREATAAFKTMGAAKKKNNKGYGVKVTAKNWEKNIYQSKGLNTAEKKRVVDRIKSSINALDAVAKALGMNITVADLSKTEFSGSNGYYNPVTNEIVLDVNAGGMGKNTLLFTASHELVHTLREKMPNKFDDLADFLMEKYAESGVNIDKLIAVEQNKAERNGANMTYDQAYEEVVAQAMQRFLTDSDFVERLAELNKKDASLAKKLVEKLKEILNKIRAAYEGLDTTDGASQAVKEMGEVANELYAKMEEALLAIGEASQTIGSRNLKDFSAAKTTSGKELFQYKAMEADEETYRQMLKKHGIMSDAEINKLFTTVDKALVIIKNNLEVLDYAWEADIDDRSFSPVKPNSDSLYKVSLDFSTLCRKRILQQVIQTQLQDALNKPLSREESIAIRDELMKIQEEGRQIEIACALCYVESARMKSPAQIKKFLKNRDAVIKEFLASKSGGDIKQKIAQAEADARERLGVGNATLKSMPNKIAEQIREAKREAKNSYTPTAEEQNLIDAAKSMSVTDFTSPEGLANLAKNYPVLFDAYTSFVRNATKSKGIEKDTWWRAGDSNSIGDTLIANMNRENGLRSQSWSDFQVIHILDYIAATIELSTRNAKEQAYSKVPDYIELMGNTGVMLNMSLIPMAKFNGKLEYDGVEGMAYKKALELREKYHATAGTVCIGISDEQIKMLLDDSTIDYVIPYHKSGMAAHIRKLMHIPTWSEYEKYQNETNLSRGEALKQAKKYGVELLSESDENYHKHTAFSEWFDIKEARKIAEQENAFPSDAKLQKKLGKMYGGYMAMQNAANNYLKLCAERGISPKFSHENANFTTEANYWKLLIDRKMVDNVTGEIIEQQAIKPIFDEGEVLRILNDELERYPGVKADQDYATRTVVEKFLSGKMNDRLDADTVAAIMQKPVDNITTTNIVASEEGIKAQYADTVISCFSKETQSSFEIKSLNDYIGVQKSVIKVLSEEGFFSDRKNVVANKDSGMEIEITKDGIRETLGKGTRFQTLPKQLKILKLSVIRSLPNLIETARLDNNDVPNYHNISSKLKYAYFSKDVIMKNEDGEKEYTITISVRKSPQKNLFWIHKVIATEKEQGLSSSGDISPQQEYNKTLALDGIISQDEEVVKTNQKNPTTTEGIKHQYSDTEPTVTEYTDKEKVAHNQTAIEYFGKTNNWDETGYLLLDATRLDFSGKKRGMKKSGVRFIGHTEIDDAFDSSYAGEKKGAVMNQFMSEGNIRISGEFGGIGLSVQPNKVQERALASYISTKKGEIRLDLYDNSGNVLKRVEYPKGTYTGKILNDIGSWFTKGIEPKAESVATSTKDNGKKKDPTTIDSDGKALSNGQKRFFKNTKARAADGSLLVLYHGTATGGFTVFSKSKDYAHFLSPSLDVAKSYSASGGFTKKFTYELKRPSVIERIKGDTSPKLYGPSANYKVYVNIENPLIVHGNGDYWQEISDHDADGNAISDPLSTKQWAKKALDEGYDGVIFKDIVDYGNDKAYDRTLPATDVYAVFDSNQIKSVANKNPTKNPDIRYQYADENPPNTDYAPTFYSQMGKVVEGVKQEKLAANSIVNMLRGKGVKAEEIRWSGIVQFLDGKKSVTKQELLDFIAGGQLQIGEQMSTNDIDLRYDSSSHAYIHYDSNGNIIDTYTYNEFVGGYVSEKSEEIYSNPYELQDALREEYGNMASPRWAEYKLDGGENYREIVFTMPNSSYTNNAMRTHWGEDAEGVLAHARIQDMTTADGKKMLFIEEIQSDWHNEGHKRGYAEKLSSEQENRIAEIEVQREKLIAERNEIMREIRSLPSGNKSVNELLHESGFDRKYEDLSQQIKRLEHELWTIYGTERTSQFERPHQEGIPDAPFRTTYHEYVLKRLLRMAAEQGYDSIGWTPAEIQSKRWSDEFAEGYRIEYDQDIPKFLRKYGKQWGASVGKTTIDGIEVWSMDVTGPMKNSVLYEGQTMFQYKDEDPIDNRSILAQALESAAQNDIERQKLKEYREKVDLINAAEARLSELNAQIKTLSFAKGKRDVAKINELRTEAKKIVNRIITYDRQLLRLEAAQPLMNVVEREKSKLRKKMDQMREDAVREEREKRVAAIEEIRERYSESRKKAIEGRHKTQMRTKIKGVVSELNQLLLKGTKDKHVMIGLQRAVASALAAVNMDTAGADERVAKYDALIAKAKDPDVIASLTETRDRILAQGDRMNERLTALRNAYNEIKNSKDPLIANSHDGVIDRKIESVVESIGDTPLRDMTLEQLEKVYDMYKMVLTTIRNSNKAFKMEKAEAISTLGNNVMREINSIAGSKEYTVKALEFAKKAGWSFLKPTQAFELIGSGTLKEIFANVRAGEDTWAVDINEAREFFRDKASKYGYNSWDFNKQYDFVSKSGKPFSLSLEQIMSMYAYSKRKQADLHLDQGGFVFDDSLEVVEKKGLIPVKYKVNTARAHSISKDALTVIVGKLTDEQKAFADEMQTYLSEVMGEKGNEVSLEMYGVKLFKEKHYFPLKSAEQFTFEQNEVAGEVRIKNSGFSKDTVPNANNPIILSNFMDVWAKHVNDMAMYHSFVLPLEDFNRVFNYKTPTGDKRDTESVKMYLQNAYGTQSVQYIKQLLTDLNGGARVDPNADIVNKGIALFKKGAVFASASVVIQQPSSIARAFAYIDPKYFATAKVDLRKHSTDWEECKQYAPVARIKEMGYFDTNVGMQTTDWIKAKEYKGFVEKLKGLKDSDYRDEILSKAPALADELAWTHIWNAVKKEVASTTGLEVGSEAFLKKAGERFTEVIVNTQVYDSVLSRSGMMRSKDTGMKMATAFMAEPTTTLNMMVNSFVQAKRGNKKFARKIVGGVASSIILNSILVSLVYAARDDDEDETYLEKYLGSLTSELLDGFNPLTYIPFIKDGWSVMQGYSIERSDMANFIKLWESFEGLFDENKGISDKVLGFAGSVASLLGFPLKNITRDVEAMINIATNELGIKDTTSAGIGYSLSDALRNSTPLLGRFYEEDTKAEKLYDAFLSGNETQIARIKSGYTDEETAATAMKNEVKKRFMSGELDAETATDYLLDYCGLSAEDAYWVMDKWEFEAENGSTEGYSKRDTLYDAILSGDEAEIEGASSGYKDEEAVDSAMRSEIKERYLNGELDSATASEYLEEYGDMETEDVYWKVREWDYEKEHGTSEGYSKYSDFYTAVQTGKNIKAIIKDYTTHGVSEKTLASQITSYYKPLYREMSKRERAAIKGYLLNAYALLGYNRTEKSKDIDKWLED